MHMDENICKEVREKINYRLDKQENRMDNHSQRIDLIENGYSRLDERLNNLIVQIESLNTTIKWFLGLLMGSFIGFFFYAVQMGVL